MSEIRLPPLRLNSQNSAADTPRSNTSSLNGNLSARERRRNKKRSGSATGDNGGEAASINSRRRLPSPTKSTRTSVSEERVAAGGQHKMPRRKAPRALAAAEDGHENSGYVSDEGKNNADQVRRSRRSQKDEAASAAGTQQKPRKANKRNNRITTSNLAILEGLEEDIVDTNDYETEASNRVSSDNYTSDTAQKSLIRPPNENMNFTRKSMPTDKYYLETAGDKFEIQPKQVYEKRVAMKQQTQLEAELRLKQKEELRYQILTPKISLNTHKFLRIIFLFIHGINVGTQFWHAVIVYCLNYLSFADQTAVSVTIFWAFKNLALPFHCLSYFLLTLCIIDTMDRVDFTRMNLNYFIKCITFQNNFWSIIFYAVAFVSTLSMIYVDDVIFINYLSTETNSTVLASQYKEIEDSVDVWKSMSAVKAAFTMLAWLLFTVFSEHDMTHESLEKREFSLLDDLVKTDSNSNKKQQPTTVNNLEQTTTYA